jgi:hypothetical protein
MVCCQMIITFAQFAYFYPPNATLSVFEPGKPNDTPQSRNGEGRHGLDERGAIDFDRFAARKRDPRSRWIGAMRERRGANIAAVALGNKNARVLIGGAARAAWISKLRR